MLVSGDIHTSQCKARRHAGAPKQSLCSGMVQRCARGSEKGRAKKRCTVFRRKKPALISRFFECGRRERMTRIFDAALRAVAKATLSRCARLKPPSEVLILVNSGRKKTCFNKQVFRMWSAREDSNLRPTGPKPVALPSCATRRIGAHVTAADSERQRLFITWKLTA